MNRARLDVSITAFRLPPALPPSDRAGGQNLVLTQHARQDSNLRHPA